MRPCLSHSSIVSRCAGREWGDGGEGGGACGKICEDPAASLAVCFDFFCPEDCGMCPCIEIMWVHSSVVRAADRRSAGPWLKSGCALGSKLDLNAK